MRSVDYFNGHSSRQLLIFLLLSNASQKYLLLNLENQENLVNKVLSYYEGRDFKLLKKNNSKNIYKKLYFNLKINIYFFKLRRYLLKNATLIRAYGDEINLEFIIKKSDIYILEDGIGTYIKLKEKIKIRKVKKVLYKIIWGVEPIISTLDNRIKKIYLTDISTVPKEIYDKVEIINLKELWNNKSPKEKEIILDIFNFKYKILDIINNNTIMLFTQPLSEDNILSEKEKIELYSKILKKYDKKFIVIKPHPREQTDYSKIFREYYIMTEKYPIEILELMNIKIKKAVTIFSTSVFGLGKNTEIDFYGTKIHYKILKNWGDSDLIMKANAFLEEE